MSPMEVDDNNSWQEGKRSQIIACQCLICICLQVVFPGRCQNGICDTWPKFKIQLRSAEDNLNIQAVLPSPFSAQNLTTTKQVGRLKGWKVRPLPPIVVVTGIRAMITSRPSSRRPARAWGCWCWGCQYKWGKKVLIDFCWNTNLHDIVWIGKICLLGKAQAGRLVN